MLWCNTMPPTRCPLQSRGTHKPTDMQNQHHQRRECGHGPLRSPPVLHVGATGPYENHYISILRVWSRLHILSNHNHSIPWIQSSSIRLCAVSEVQSEESPFKHFFRTVMRTLRLELGQLQFDSSKTITRSGGPRPWMCTRVTGELANLQNQ